MISALISEIVLLAGLFLGFSALFLAAVLVHEAGHILGGILCGFRIIAVKIGPVKVSLFPSIQWTWDWNRFLIGFVTVQFRKMPGPWAMWQCSVLFLAGSIFNLCVSFLLFPFAVRDNAIANVYAFFILISTLGGISQLIPFTVKGWRNDGAKLCSLFFNQTKRDELIFQCSVIARFNEFKSLYKAHRLQEALDKIEKLISGCKLIPSLQANTDGMEKLSKLRDKLQQNLSGAVNTSPESILNLD
ncbi:MAG TPA: site-2 protease family protein [Terracidiphilus sp.]|nr:site-2 protease family protein [Terracidiphilus sp.]